MPDACSAPDNSIRRPNPVLRISVWLAAVIAVITGAVLLVLNAPQPATQPPTGSAPGVAVIRVSPQDQAIPVHSRGHVRMTREFYLSSQVQGRVLQVSDRFINGQQVQQGELLLTIDPAPYELEVRQQQASLDRHLLQREEILAKAEVARQQATESDFARYIPHLRMANSQVAAARAALQYAQQQLRDTRIYAPVSGRIARASIQPGQQVSPALVLGVIYDDQWQEIRLPVSDHEAQLLGIRPGTDHPLPAVTLTTAGGTKIPAHITGTEAGRDNFQQIMLLARPHYSADMAPLLPGTFVEAEILSPVITGVSRVPRSAMQAGNHLLLVDEQHQLHDIAARVLYAGKDQLYLHNTFSAPVWLVNSSRHALLPGIRVVPVDSAGQEQLAAAAGE
ncbi:MAG: efflux RND transporter periplasmic adaptor subunit [Saccharospirillaceae bacterium]|nr:efflux RND transporter periplasmic adaptor subunit [Saccharospirillaceae bacterium]MCD8531556.1 efflux RND transporter periplasmic adaptor subunit [Saccharospirillaceae bacterium]